MSASFSGFERRSVTRVDDRVPAAATDAETLAVRRSYARSVNSTLTSALAYRPSDDLRILCECGQLRCHEWITLSSEAYQAIRGDERSYIVAPGHEAPDVGDRITERYSAYTVVETRSA